MLGSAVTSQSPTEGIDSIVASVFAALGIAAPLAVCLFSSPSPNNSLMILPPLAITVYSAGRLALLVRRSEAAPLQVTFWLYVYTFLGIAGMVQMWTGMFPFMPVSDERLDVTIGYVAVVAGLATFELALHRARDTRGPIVAYLRQSISTNRLMWLTAVGVVSSIAVIAVVGGVQDLFLSRQTLDLRIEEGAELSVNTLAVLGTALRVPLSVAFLGWLVIVARPGINVRRLTPLLILAPAVLVVNNPISTPRFSIGTFSIAAILILFPLTNARRTAAFAILSVVTILVVFPAVDVFRYSTSVSALGEFATGDAIADIATNPDFDSPEEIAGAVGLVRSQGHTLGRQSLGVALFFVPREMWAAKPDATASMVADYLSLPIRNVAMPLWGFLYVEGGLVVVMAGFYLYGLGISHLDRAYRNHRNHPTSIAHLAIPLLAGYQFFLLRGDPLPTVGYLAPMVACLAVLGSWQHLNTRRQDLSQRAASGPIV